MDIIGNMILNFFGNILLPLFLPFFILAALAIIAGERPERALQMGFALFETFIAGGLKLLFLAAKTIYRLINHKRLSANATKDGFKKPTVVISDPD